MTPRLCFAYGSNLKKAQMAERCPQAIAVCRATLPGYQLQFRFYADIAEMAGAEVHGAVYELTPDCEASLDRYEGVRTGSYRKENVMVRPEFGEEMSCLVYIMTASNPQSGKPTAEYYERITTGYADWGIDFAPLLAAREGA